MARSQSHSESLGRKMGQLGPGVWLSWGQGRREGQVRAETLTHKGPHFRTEAEGSLRR